MGTEGVDCEEEGGADFSLRKRERRRELALFCDEQAVSRAFPLSPGSVPTRKFVKAICQVSLSIARNLYNSINRHVDSENHLRLVEDTSQ